MEEKLTEFNMVEPFHVDDGELNDLTLQQVFVLGVEFEMIRAQLETGAPFERMFHSDNIDRVEKMCNRQRRFFNIALHDDWPVLAVDAED